MFLEKIRALNMKELSQIKIKSILSLLFKRLSIPLHVMHVVSFLLMWPQNVLNVNLTSMSIVWENKLENREWRNFFNDKLINFHIYV
jgi:hypothetical protein